MANSIASGGLEESCFEPDLIEAVIRYLLDATDPTTGTVAHTFGLSRDASFALLTFLQEQGRLERYKIRRDGTFIAKPWRVVADEARI